MDLQVGASWHTVRIPRSASRIRQCFCPAQVMPSQMLCTHITLCPCMRNSNYLRRVLKMKGMGKRALGRTDQETVETHLLCARVGAWKANTRAYSRGRFSLGSQGLVRQLLRPRNLPNRVRAGMSAGVSICIGAKDSLMSAKDSLIPFPQSICLSAGKIDIAPRKSAGKTWLSQSQKAYMWSTPAMSHSVGPKLTRRKRAGRRLSPHLIREHHIILLLPPAPLHVGHLCCFHTLLILLRGRPGGLISYHVVKLTFHPYANTMHVSRADLSPSGNSVSGSKCEWLH